MSTLPCILMLPLLKVVASTLYLFSNAYKLVLSIISAPALIHSSSKSTDISITTVFHLSFLINLTWVSGLSGKLGTNIAENL